MQLGVHVSIEGSFAEAARRARKLGCACFQIFAGPPRNFARKMPSDADAGEFRALVKRHDLRPVVVHAGYLLHLISAKPTIAAASRGLYRRELEVAAALGADYYVLHPGSSARRPRGEVRDALVEAILSARVEGPMVLVENAASANAAVGARFEEIAQILEKLDDATRFAMAFDTAHATGAGYDLSTPDAVRASLRALFKTVGKSCVKLVHANDSKGAVGSNRDLHQHIGRGAIGKAGFAALMADRTLAKLPFILETPIDMPGDDRRNLAALRRIAAAKRKRPRR